MERGVEGNPLHIHSTTYLLLPRNLTLIAMQQFPQYALPTDHNPPERHQKRSFPCLMLEEVHSHESARPATYQTQEMQRQFTNSPL